MFKNKYLNPGYLSLATVVFAIVISISLVNAESPLDNYNNQTLPYVVSISAQQERDEGGSEEEEDSEEYEFYIKGMTCGSCEVKVKEALLKCAGVKTASASHEEGYAVIGANSDLLDYDEIVRAVKNAGFTVLDEE
ncbi:MAG: cation transporter [Candidatus Scalindua rubra]|uniref:Zinc/cadmium/mercury/lead-transporting ATPase n=1 Tax=Candidatus Scalindua brodae TaxID=237368 RepID=A0A0B0EJS3_9BACT|nr:MAG: zinc/cadmium/mercury/lead-transporting ATPase [Candidatus Scalindua brodae]MBZ0109095.1 cation transporter [Candidatus Scalindua rubra]TWU33530.1 zinc/cadmium/mercury/lead-transporting ATPase [Candidatus Brocadiaceae bacterium S225]